MEWDLGLGGFAYLLAMSLLAAVVAQVWAWRSAPHRLWAAATVVYVVIGVLVSEVWFGWATEEDLQPNIDGLSRDEVLLALVLSVVATALGARAVARRRHGGSTGRHLAA